MGSWGKKEESGRQDNRPGSEMRTGKGPGKDEVRDQGLKQQENIGGRRKTKKETHCASHVKAALCSGQQKYGLGPKWVC